ncbi:NG-dimethylarginine dimethylaminohydrolase 1 [Nonlabens ulvanivorans]|nr:NG-dimethylarginine dimethylaminohydrolase 1 [Nonlabens ulvanivorans]
MRAVILGTAASNGPVPALEDAYDPKSREHILAGTILQMKIWLPKWMQ